MTNNEWRSRSSAPSAKVPRRTFWIFQQILVRILCAPQRSPRPPIQGKAGSLSASGEGGIRTLGTREGTLVFETSHASTQGIDKTTVTESSPSVLPSGLPESVTNDPEFVQIAEAWEGLPKAVKAGIGAIVQAATTEQR